MALRDLLERNKQKEGKGPSDIQHLETRHGCGETRKTNGKEQEVGEKKRFEFEDLMSQEK